MIYVVLPDFDNNTLLTTRVWDRAFMVGDMLYVDIHRLSNDDCAISFHK